MRNDDLMVRDLIVKTVAMAFVLAALLALVCFGPVSGQDRIEVELTGDVLDQWLEMTCSQEYVDLVEKEKAKSGLEDRSRLFHVSTGISGFSVDSLRKLGACVDCVPHTNRDGTKTPPTKESPIGPDGLPYDPVLMMLFVDNIVGDVGRPDHPIPRSRLSNDVVRGFAVVRACYFQREPKTFISDEYGNPRWWVDNRLVVRPWGEAAS